MAGKGTPPPRLPSTKLPDPPRSPMLKVHIFPDKVQSGAAAAARGASLIRQALQNYGTANIVVATAPSQNEMYDALVAEKDLDWGKVNIFHLDEYIGLDDHHPASFRFNLHKTFLDRLPIPPMAFHPVQGENPNPQEVCDALEREIGSLRLDVAFIGIGENGHIAFNDPPADFDTKRSYLPVQLDEVCRHQQFAEGWFPTMEGVPKVAISMSVPQIFRAKAIINTVPDARKAAAVAAAVEGPVTNLCPASILQTHPDCHLYLDAPAASQLKGSYQE